jgi:trehalose synthase
MRGWSDQEAELIREVEVPPRPLSRFSPLIGPKRTAALADSASRAQRLLRGRIVWNVSSTSAGGGVAEMLRVLVGYARDAGIDTRWLVITGDPDFFAITKRIHNRLHGVAGDEGELGARESAHYDKVLHDNAESILSRVRPGDIVLLHDPQTAGLAKTLADAGARVVWRCHVGRETTNFWTDQAWGFLRGYLGSCDAYVFSLAAYVPEWIDDHKTVVIPPSIDPFSSKNEDLSASVVEQIVSRLGLLPSRSDRDRAQFTRGDGTFGEVRQRASIWAMGDLPIDPLAPLVIQVSRWDHIKDMAGVMSGFASFVAGRSDAQLALIGPSTAGVSDDSEGSAVLAECVAAWEDLPTRARGRIFLLALPMEDIDENAAMVNALQRYATVVVQKSLAEGFGLTVSEGMWKAKAVIASAVGGIPQQIPPGTGVLLEDPTDLEGFGDVLRSLLDHPSEIAEMGKRARAHVLAGFIGDLHLMRYTSLMEELG